MTTTLTRLRSEFLEMPGLRLTAEQARRLCGVELVLCIAALELLVTEKFLRRHAVGTYTLLNGEPVARPRRTRMSER